MDLSARLEDIHRRLGLLQSDVGFIHQGLGSRERATPETEVRGDDDQIRGLIAERDHARESLRIAVRLKLKAQSERRKAIAACLRACGQTIMENAMDRPQAIAYLSQYADTVLAGGPPTPDLAAQPDSNTDTDSQWGMAPDTKTHRIGVHDYDSLVSCLRSNYLLAFPDAALSQEAGEALNKADPQQMIQWMAAAIQNLRREKENA